MLFHSLDFVVFFAVVLLLYAATQRHLRLQNLMLLAASYVFYGWWDWYCLALLVGATSLDYFVARIIHASADARVRLTALMTTITVQGSVLCAFKYFDFFATSLQAGLNGVGIEVSLPLLQLILPAGISFYTFQSLSYTIDVYRGDIKPVRYFPDYALFVVFFPQLLAGPIERAGHLIPQIETARVVTGAKIRRGAYLFLWGFFLKVAVADRLASIVDPVFEAAVTPDGMSVLLASYAFAFQIFGDFGGYSLMAIGIAQILGFDLIENFRRPYLALNPSDFWQRWHISLSRWFRDYVYIPLGGNRMASRAGIARNLFLTMMVTGLWHGANWTFVVWGIYHCALLIVYHRFSALWDGLPRALRMVVMFHLVCLGWLIFRARDLSQAWQLMVSLATDMTIGAAHLATAQEIVGIVWLVVAMHVYKEFRKDSVALLRESMPVRYAVVSLIFSLIIGNGTFSDKPFIYFQF